MDEPMDGWKDIQTDRWTDERFSARIATAIKRKGLKEIWKIKTERKKNENEENVERKERMEQTRGKHDDWKTIKTKDTSKKK